jgi:hypothetical protein
MKLRRIFAGTIVSLLLSVSPLAVACDLSCAFASMNSDCHAQRAEIRDAASGGMQMDGMGMDGMTMPGIAHSLEHQAASTISGAMPNHPSIGEMEPCEKQCCDGDSAVSDKTRRSLLTEHNLILTIVENPRAISAARLIRDARDDIATHHIRNGNPLHPSLRI